MTCDPLTQRGEIIGTICREDMETIVDQPYLDGEPRWCFTCRKRLPFRYIVQQPVEISYYGASPSVRCTGCGAIDGDCFPGSCREWEDPT